MRIQVNNTIILCRHAERRDNKIFFKALSSGIYMSEYENDDDANSALSSLAANGYLSVNQLFKIMIINNETGYKIMK